MFYIDGTHLSDLWKSKRPPLITSGQLNFILHEIQLQIQGYGVKPAYDNKLSIEVNKQRYTNYYDNYWYNPPGDVVGKKE